MKIRLSGHHCLTTICDVPYLMPYGQGIVTFERQCKLNNSAARLWCIIHGALNTAGELDREDLVSLLSFKGVPDSDASEYIDSLIDAGALIV